MGAQTLAYRLGKDVLLPAGMEDEVSEMATAHNDGKSRTTDPTARAIKFGVAHHCTQNMLFKVNQA